MKRTVLFLGLVSAVSTVCFADIASDVAYKSYTPTFGDYMEVFLTAKYDHSGDDYVVVIFFHTKPDGAMSIEFNIIVVPNKIGLQFYNELLPTWKKNLRARCELWTKIGYPVDFDKDFVFTVTFVD